jgi:hypothetical protein
MHARNQTVFHLEQTGTWRWIPALAAIVILALATVSCFDFKPPVTEKIEIAFHPEGEATIQVISGITNPKKHFEDNKHAQNRIRQTQRGFLEGLDPWTRRFGNVAWSSEWFSWEKEEGELIKAVHGGAVDDPAQLRDLFKDTLIDFNYSVGDDYAELVIYPYNASRATRQQQRRLAEHTDEWIEAIAVYIAAVVDLYRYLEEQPHRAEACFGEIYDDNIAPERAEMLEETTEEEDALLEAMNEPLETILSILEYEGGADYSLEEISRLVHDPFPAPLTIALSGEVLEVRGFEKTGAWDVAHSGISMWEAFERLEGKWHAPDVVLPLLPYLLGEISDDTPIDFDAILNRPRVAAYHPTPQEVRERVEEALKPEGEYLVRWRIAERE